MSLKTQHQFTFLLSATGYLFIFAIIAVFFAVNFL